MEGRKAIKLHNLEDASFTFHNIPFPLRHATNFHNAFGRELTDVNPMFRTIQSCRIRNYSTGSIKGTVIVVVAISRIGCGRLGYSVFGFIFRPFFHLCTE